MTGDPLLYALLVLMTVGWTGNYIAGKIALHYFPPVLLYGLRISTAAVMMVPVYLWQRRRETPRWTRRDLPLMIVIGVFGVSLNQFLFVLGLSRTSVAHSSIFANLSPILVLLLASARGLEKLTPQKAAGVAVSLAGVVLLRALDAHPQGKASLLGDFLTCCGSLAFSLFTVLGKPTAKQHGSITVNSVAYIGGAIMLAPVTLWQAARCPLANVPWPAWAAVFYMALLPSVVCYLIYYYALGRMEASRLAAINYTQPPLATLASFWILGESVSLTTIAPALVIFSGIYMVERAR